MSRATLTPRMVLHSIRQGLRQMPLELVVDSETWDNPDVPDAKVTEVIVEGQRFVIEVRHA